jgi:hypothetical protein
LPTFRQVDASAMLKPAVPKRRREDPELAQMIKKIRTITDASVVYEVSLEDGETAAKVRQRLLRASKLADIEVAIRKSPKGWYVGLMTPARRSTRGRKPKAAAEAQD